MVAIVFKEVHIASPLLVIQNISLYSSLNWCRVPIEGFNVTLYQANFASHHTHDRHVGFLLAWNSIKNTTKCPFTFC